MISVKIAAWPLISHWYMAETKATAKKPNQMCASIFNRDEGRGARGEGGRAREFFDSVILIVNASAVALIISVNGE
jgi:hypothetical protein